MPWGLLTVELIVCGWILVVLAADLILPPARQASLWLVALAGVALATAALLAGLPSSQSFQGMFLADAFARFFKLLFLGTAAVVIVMTKLFGNHLAPQRVGAFYLLLLTALLGMLVLASFNDLLMLFLGLELLTFSLYIMAAYLKTDPRAVEAGMKYLILGSVSSGLLVYGIALLYGVAGSTSFPILRAALATGAAPVAAQAGMLLVFAGLGFKIAAVPFHLWVPDVYQGAPTPVVAFLSVGSKAAGAVALLRLLSDVFAPLAPLWGGLLATLSAATLLYGNLGAVTQTNVKRLLGYSSIGHAGYLLMGLAAGSTLGREAVGYYLLAYALSTLTVFLVLTAASDALGGDEVEHFAGLSKRSGWLAAAMFVGLLSLAGMPPLAGFVGKLFVLLAAMEGGRLWLAALGAVNVAVSLYYYLMVVKRMYLDPPPQTDAIPVQPVTKLVLGLLILGILAAGIVQQPFLAHVQRAVQP